MPVATRRRSVQSKLEFPVKKSSQQKTKRTDSSTEKLSAILLSPTRKCLEPEKVLSPVKKNLSCAHRATGQLSDVLSPRRSEPRQVLSPVKDNIICSSDLTVKFYDVLSPSKRRLEFKAVNAEDKVQCSPSKRRKEVQESHSAAQSLTPCKLNSVQQQTPGRSSRCLNFSSPCRKRNESTPVQSPRPLRCAPLSKASKENTPVKTPRTKFASPSRKGDENSPIKSPRSLRFTSPNRSNKEDWLTPVKSPNRTRSAQSTPRKSPRQDDKSATVRALFTPSRLPKQEGVCYQRAKQALHTALPDNLICREKETEKITGFIDMHIERQKCGSMYISGAPGTGKTAVMSTIIKDLQEDKSRKIIYVNCMSIRNSQAIYSKIASELNGKPTKLPSKQAATELEKLFTKKGDMVILILDEMDQLDSKNQEVLYTVFEWATLPKSRLILLGIANSLDLTDRILPRLQAHPRCKPEILNFTPYSRDEIAKVLQSRLAKLEVEGETVMEPSAVRFCACKVAAVAGDMRKALDICRRAIEKVETELKQQQRLQTSGSTGAVYKSPAKKLQGRVPRKINVAHISAIVNEVYGSHIVASSTQEEQTIPLQQKVAICTLLLLFKQGKQREVTLGKFHETYCKVCRKQHVGTVDQSEFVSICSMLEARGIMALKRGKDTRSAKVTLKLDEQEVEFALKDKLLMSTILQNGIPK